MINLVLLHLKKSIINLKMLIVIILGFAMLFSALIVSGYVFTSDIQGYQTGADMLLTYTIPFATSSFVIFAGIFPAIPYSYSYIEEKNCGYLRFIQLRMSRKKYAGFKIVFTGLSGGVSMLIIAILIFGVIDIISIDTTIENHPYIFEQLIWKPYIYIWGGRYVLFLKAILLLQFGVLWSEVALLLSFISKNKYIAFIMPFLIYQLCGLLIKKNEYNPIFLLRSDFDLNTSIAHPFVLNLLYILLVICVNWILFTRITNNE